MTSKVPTGIPGLDELLNGGLPENGIYVVFGKAGTGKSILSHQFIYSGATEYGDKGVSILLEETKDRIVNNFSGFGWDFDMLEKKGDLKIIPYVKSIVGDVEACFTRDLSKMDSHRLEYMREILTIDSLIRQIEEAVESIDAKRVVIDPISMITLLSESEILTRMQLLSMFEKLRRMDVTTLVVAEEDVGYWKDTLFLSDGIIHTVLKENRGIYERGILLRKMRGTGHDTGVRPIKITDKGIEVKTDEIIMQGN